MGKIPSLMESHAHNVPCPILSTPLWLPSVFFLALHVGPHVRKLGENRGKGNEVSCQKKMPSLKTCVFFSVKNTSLIKQVVNWRTSKKRIHQNGHNMTNQSRRFQGRSIQAVKAPPTPTPSRPRKTRRWVTEKTASFPNMAVNSKKTPTYPWSIPQESLNPPNVGLGSGVCFRGMLENS